MIIDADGHTQIPQEVFDNYMDKEFYRNRPRFVTFDDGRGFYLIEGRLITKPFGWVPARREVSPIRHRRSRSKTSISATSPAGWPIWISRVSICR